MDPFAPINGISLERYAEIGAALDGKDQDKAATAAVLQAEGVSQADWDAAKTGWTARMQDMSLMGRVATAFMPLYQAALAKKQGGAVRISYEDFVHGSALIKAYGFEAAMVAANITMNEWTQAAGYWTNQMSANMMQYAGHSGRIEQEEAQLRSGALQPRHLTKTMDQSAAAQQGPSQAQAIAAANQDPIAAAMNSPAMLQQQAANAAIMQNPLGFGLGQAASFLTGGIVAGSRVFVMWSDGNRYPAQVMQAAPDQYLVSFEGNGAQQWVPANAVVKG
ncbi:MAG: hypothetical protein KIT72_00760 [Polyangiaceae bacterium]|nr:hypothetical protein [Polyangiaceae bacterium]MCW5788926.1 hypothetical protein [Polyangiaceae bacterium]